MIILFNFRKVRKDLSSDEKMFEKYVELMRLAYKFPNEVNTICMGVIISIHVMSGADDDTFKQILKEMYFARQDFGSREDIIKEHCEELGL